MGKKKRLRGRSIKKDKQLKEMEKNRNSGWRIRAGVGGRDGWMEGWRDGWRGRKHRGSSRQGFMTGGAVLKAWGQGVFSSVCGGEMNSVCGSY